MTPELTVVYLTYRPGGIDLLVESLCQQPPELYELVLIDDYPGRPERGKVRRYLKSKGIPLRYHGPSKPRPAPRSKCGFVNAVNTGALWATSSYVVLLNDYLWLPPGALLQWRVFRDRRPPRTLLAGILSVRDTNAPDCTGDLSVWRQPLHQAPHRIGIESELWVPEIFETCYSGFPVSFFEESNGLNEDADSGFPSWAYLSIVAQAKKLGYRLVVDRRLHAIMADHRAWPEARRGQWNVGGLAEEFRDVTPPEDWPAVSPNPYNFADLHKMYLDLKGA